MKNLLYYAHNKGDNKMRHKVMLFNDCENSTYKVMKYSRKERDYVVLFKGTRSECINYMMKT